MPRSATRSLSEDRLAEAWRLSNLLISVTEQARAEFAEIVAGFGLPVHLSRALLLLERPAPMGEVADHLACDPSYVTALADKLEERGLAVRESGQDRRVKLLVPTPEGAALRDRITEAVSEHSLVLRRLDDTERQTLAPLLARLAGEPTEPEL